MFSRNAKKNLVNNFIKYLIYNDKIYHKLLVSLIITKKD